MPQNELDRCPITDLEIVYKQYHPNWQTDPDWTSIVLSNNLLIRYTKKADKLPVTTFGIDIDEPCMDSGA